MLSRQPFVQTLTFCRQDSRVLLKAILIFALLVKVWGQEAMHEKEHLSDLMRRPVNNTPLASIAGWSHSIWLGIKFYSTKVLLEVYHPPPPQSPTLNTAINFWKLRRIQKERFVLFSVCRNSSMIYYFADLVLQAICVLQNTRYPLLDWLGPNW